MNIKKIVFWFTHFAITLILVRANMYCTLALFISSQLLQGMYLIDECYKDASKSIDDTIKEWVERREKVIRERRKD